MLKQTLGIDPDGNHVTGNQVENHLMLVGPHGSGKGTVMLRAAHQANLLGLEVLVIDVSRLGKQLGWVTASMYSDTTADAGTLLTALLAHMDERIRNSQRDPWGLLLIHGLQELDADLDHVSHPILSRVLVRAQAAGLRIISTTTSTGGQVRKVIRAAVHSGATPAVLLMGDAPHFVTRVVRADAPMPEVVHNPRLGRGTLVSPMRGAEVGLVIPPLAL